MEEVTIYEKTTCSKCRMAIQILDESGVPYRTVVYHDEPLTEAKLRELLKKLGMRATELLRRHDPVFRELKLAGKDITDDETVRLMLEYPDLIERPILERGNEAIVGRPSERIMPFLKSR